MVTLSCHLIQKCRYSLSNTERPLFATAESRGCRSAVEHLPRISEARGLIPSLRKERERARTRTVGVVTASPDGMRNGEMRVAERAMMVPIIKRELKKERAVLRRNMIGCGRAK